MPNADRGRRVLLIGIGADGTNTKPLPPIYDDGTFEYVPIPETQTETAEPKNYDNWEFTYQDTTAASYFRRIRPSKDNGWIGDDNFSEHPFHRDPNLESLTFGDKKGSNGTGGDLEKLQQGDILGFYAGLQGRGRKHRYIIGYFTVSEVTDLDQHPSEHRDNLLNEHPDNAHSMRYRGEGQLKHSDVVIVDGKSPGGLLAEALQISSFDRFGSSQYYLKDEFAEQFNVRNHSSMGTEKEQKEWLGYKDPLWLDIGPGEFRTGIPNLRHQG
jgi:hypothetical protein